MEQISNFFPPCPFFIKVMVEYTRDHVNKGKLVFCIFTFLTKENMHSLFGHQKDLFGPLGQILRYKNLWINELNQYFRNPQDQYAQNQKMDTNVYTSWETLSIHSTFVHYCHLSCCSSLKGQKKTAVVEDCAGRGPSSSQLSKKICKTFPVITQVVYDN